MIYKKNLVVHLGLLISLLGIALYDPLGSIYEGAGLIVLVIGLICLFVGNKNTTEYESINRAVEKIRKKIILGKDHKKLLNNLAELRKKAGLTQQELSESADVSRKSINAIENGIYVPSTVLALKISKTLGCKVEDLFKLPDS